MKLVPRIKVVLIIIATVKFIWTFLTVQDDVELEDMITKNLN